MHMNFKQFNYKANLKGDIVEVDLTEVLGEQIYQRGKTLKEKILAEKIYKSDGEIELTEEEKELIRSFAPSFFLPIQCALLEI